MATPPARTEISDTYPNPSNAVARVGFGKLWDYATGLLGPTGDPAEARAALGIGSTISGRQRLINGSFNVNQLAVSGSVVLAAGAYGHDGWKAGAAGCTYTFATVAGATTVTISAGSLVQVIEDRNVEGGTYTVSRSGTAQGRVLGGSYAAAPFQITGVTGGAALAVEFGIGTLRDVQVEPGTVATPIERRLFGQELALCQRYFCKTFNYTQAPVQFVGNLQGCVTFTYTVAGGFKAQWVFPVEMRLPPTLLGFNPFATNGNWRGAAGGDYAAPASTGIGTRQTDVTAATSLATPEIYYIHLTASARL